MPNFAPLKTVNRRFQSAVEFLSGQGFQVAPATSGEKTYVVSKDGCVAQIQPATDGGTRISAFPACVIAGEPAVLVDRGYQKFFQTSKVQIAATAERLQTLHRFSEELKEAIGYTSLYNEGLGSVSGSYHYDRVVNRDLPEDNRPIRPWQK